MRIRPPYRVVPGPPLHLRGGERELFLFEGEVEAWLPALLAQLDGRPREAIAVPGARPGEIEDALRGLSEAGLLDDRQPPRAGSVALRGASPLWARIRPLLAAEVREDADLVLVHAEATAPSALAEWNRRALADRRSWLLLSLQTAWARVGPLFVPGETACFDCYAARLAANREEPDAWRAFEALDVPAGSVPVPAHEAAVAGIAAAEVARFLGRAAPPLLAGRVLVLDLATLESSIETVLAAPYCPACGA